MTSRNVLSIVALIVFGASAFGIIKYIDNHLVTGERHATNFTRGEARSPETPFRSIGTGQKTGRLVRDMFTN